MSSNRFDRSHCNEAIRAWVDTQILTNLRNCSGGSAVATPHSGERFLEKTSKNALRIPFFDQLFPDAIFIHLWPDPCENISSLMEFWRSSMVPNYQQLPGFDRPWKALLPPDWQQMQDRPLEEIAAHEWNSANRFAISRLCEFLEVEMSNSATAVCALCGGSAAFVYYGCCLMDHQHHLLLRFGG